MAIDISKAEALLLNMNKSQIDSLSAYYEPMKPAEEEVDPALADLKQAGGKSVNNLEDSLKDVQL